MIQIGLTGWGDHPAAYSKSTKSSDKLFDYSGHFLVVELDTSFYAIPSEANILKWIKNTPESFSFVMKAYQGMTGHLRENLPYTTKGEMFEAFKEAADVFFNNRRLAMVLVQFPPWFDCQYKNVQYIRYVAEQLKKYPIAIEFRNRTWFNEQFKASTLALLKELQVTNTVCDEPQVGEGSIPLVPVVTSKKALMRLHGRNVHGWRNPGNAEQWRKVRFLYNYNDKELLEIKEAVDLLSKSAEDVYILFNNNSDYDAFPNAKALQKLLAITFEGLAPKQLDLFGGDEV